MLSESERSQRRYYSRPQAVLGLLLTVLFFFMFSSGVFASEYLGIKIFAGVSLVVMTAVGIRIVRSGIEVFDRGVRVRNVFSTFQLPWQEIEKFEIGSSGPFPRICLIHLESGGMKQAFGIQELNFPSGSAEVMADELNAELAKRTGHGSAAPQVAVDSR